MVCYTFFGHEWTLMDKECTSEKCAKLKNVYSQNEHFFFKINFLTL